MEDLAGDSARPRLRTTPLQHMPRRAAILTFTALATLSASGCVASQSSRYERQLSSMVQSDFAADEDVAMAFGLPTQPNVAVTALRDK